MNRWTPDLLVTRDTRRGMALVAGPWAEKVTRLACVDRRYSQAAHGWVIALTDMPNVDAAASVDRLRIVERKPR